MSEELKPCPVCGDTSVKIFYNDDDVASVGCRNCQFETRDFRREESAIRVWNALPRRLPWTKEKPTVEGMYWCRCIDPCRRIAGPANIMYYTPGCELVEMYDEFAGPIQEPMEESK